jgi:hypothetical protein
MFGHSFFGAAHYGPSYFGPGVTTPTPTSGGGGRGGVANWPSGYKHPYEKWWKKQKAQELRRLKEAAQKRIDRLEVRVEKARDTLDIAKTISAIERLKAALENLEIALQAERDHLAELELIEYAMVWDLYKQSLYLQ